MKWIVAILLGFELLALLPFHLPVLIGIGLVALWAGYKNLHILLAVVFGELIIGSMGRMIASGPISLRMVLFAALIIVTLIKNPQESLREIKKTPWQLKVVFLVVACAIIVGVIKGNSLSLVLADANNFGFLLLWYPIAIYRDELKKIIWPTVKVAASILAIKTLALFAYFSHHPQVQGTSVYTYFRDTRIAEITSIKPYVARIFIQSHIFLGALFLLNSERSRWFHGVWFAAFLLSLSRSLYLGLFAGLLYVCVVTRGKAIKKAVITTGSALLVITFIYYAPPFLSKPPITTLITSRVAKGINETAALSRYQQLPILWHEIKKSPVFGGGFGTVVDVQTAQSTRDNVTERTAFEWGYLDSFLKMGILGIIASLSFLHLCWSRSEKLSKSIPVYVGVIHIFTPFLFHPLGIGVLFLAILLERDST